MHGVSIKLKVSPLIVEQCTQRQRRPLAGRFLVCAGDKRQKLQDQVVSANKALNEAAEALQMRLSSVQPSSGGASTSSRDQEAWEKMDGMWRREVARWDHERVMWDEKEKRLLDQILQLQTLVLQLSSQSAGPKPSIAQSKSQILQTPVNHVPSPQAQPPEPTASDSPPPPVPESSMPETQRLRQGEKQGSAPSQAKGTASSSSPPEPQGSVLEQASRFMPPEEKPYEPVPPEDFAPLEVAVNASSRDPAVEAVRESMQAAFSAVDNDDILSVSFDGLGSHGRSTEQNGSSFVEGFAEAVEEAAVEAVAEAARLPLQGRAAADGPPVLSLGADDIFWMSKLHNALLEANLFPDEDDVENWFFGESTVSAVLTYQAFNGLPETGLVDDDTWEKLLGPEYKSIKAPAEPANAPTAAESSFHSIGASSNGASSSTSAPDPEDSALQQIRSMRASSELENRKKNNYMDRASVAEAPQLHSWPVLREGDGGKNVHYLQIALEKQGFISDVDDQRWWQFGPSTLDCVLSFQACSYLAESGIVDATTWRALLGSDATPESLTALTNEFEDDLADDTDAIWLLGEQRWERRKKVQ